MGTMKHANIAGRLPKLIRRRDLIAMLGGATVAWPLSAHSQQHSMPVVGFLRPGSRGETGPYLAAFLQGLKEQGYTEDKNVAIQYRFAEGKIERLPQLAADLVSHHVAVIAAGGPPAALAAKSATSTIPIVFMGGDPANANTIALIGSLSHPQT